METTSAVSNLRSGRIGCIDCYSCTLVGLCDEWFVRTGSVIVPFASLQGGDVGETHSRLLRKKFRQRYCPPRSGALQ